MEPKNEHSYTVRNVEDGQTVSVIGDGEFCIGLTLDERVTCSSRQSMSAKSKSSSQGVGENSIAVPLMLLTVWKTSGVTVSPASRDLKCKLNGEDIDMEAHFIPGSQVEVGDKVFELLEGTGIKQSRRHLPPTPGIPILPTPPPKPQRVNVKPTSSDSNGGQDVMREWCLSQLPNSEHELLQQTKDPNQLANLASSYLTRHINVHTDVFMSAELTDSIFKVMQEVAYHRRDILRRFLSEVITEVIEEEKVSQDNTHHAIVTSLLVEILQQFLDPSYLVLLCLQLLRALSHIPGNVATMVASNTTAAVLGSMAVYKDDEKIQNNCLDILAKLATFLPAKLEKPPLRESCIDLLTMAVTLHFKNLTIVQAGIRTLANLASSLHLLAFSTMKGSSNSDLRAYVILVISVLDYLYSKTLPLVKDALGIFHFDLTAKTDGRRFLFDYAKMDQLKSQFKLWSLARDSDVREAARTDRYNEEASNDPPAEENCGSDGDFLGIDDRFNNVETDGNGTLGILKKSRSFENLRNSVRRVSFVNEEDLPPSSPSSVESSPVSSPGETGSPDIQVLSRSRIFPDALCPSDSTESETVLLPQSALGEQERDTTSQVNSACQPLEHPLVYINSQSDGDTDADVSVAQETEDSIKTVINQPVPSNGCLDKQSVHDVDATTSNGTIKSDQNSSVQLTSHFGPYPYIPVDVTNFRYSAADIIFMKRLLSLQITCHVCSASIEGHDPPALKLIDMPLNQLLSRQGIPNAMWQFANSQFEEDTSLMDVDPNTVISVIDAVRYKILTFDLVRKSLEMLIQNLSPKIHTKMFEVTREVIESVVMDTAFSPITADDEFITSLEHKLENVRQIFHEPHPVTCIIDIIKLIIKSRLKKQDQLEK